MASDETKPTPASSSSSSSFSSRELAGRTIVTTRPEPGLVDAELTRLGAQVLHMPLIARVDPADPAALASVLRARLFPPAATTTPANSPDNPPDFGADDRCVYLVVTSAEGARRLAAAWRETDSDITTDIKLNDSLSANLNCSVKLAAVGTATADTLAELTGRAVDIVPDRQTAADLVTAFPPPRPGDHVVVAQAEQAAPTLVEGLRSRGFVVDAVVAYRTELLTPDADTAAAALAADALVLASGSAAQAWAAAIGSQTPRQVIAIGPTTAAAAADSGLHVSRVATEHSVAGLVAATVDVLTRHPSPPD